MKNWKLKAWLGAMTCLAIALILAALGGTAYAVEAVEAAGTVTDQQTAPSSGGLPIGEGIGGIAVVIFGLFLKWLTARYDALAVKEEATEAERKKALAMVQLLRDVEAGVDHAYLTVVKPGLENNGFSGKEAREAAFALVDSVKDSETAELIKQKGKEWVLAQIHKVANLKTGKQKKAG